MRRKKRVWEGLRKCKSELKEVTFQKFMEARDRKWREMTKKVKAGDCSKNLRVWARGPDCNKNLNGVCTKIWAQSLG